MRLPKYVHQRPWGSFRYKRNVPKRLLKLMGKTHVYRYLGTSYDEMIRALPEAHQSVEVLFCELEGDTVRGRTLALVRARFGPGIAEQMDAGEMNENFYYALHDRYDQLADEGIEPAVLANIGTAMFELEVLSLSKAFELYAEFKDADQDTKLTNSLARVQKDLLASIGTLKLKSLPLKDLRRLDALKYRDFLLKRVSPNSVTRYVNVVRAVVNHTIDERGLSVSNPFHKLKIKGAGNTAGDRLGLKTVSSERRLPISDRLVEALQVHRENKPDKAPFF